MPCTTRRVDTGTENVITGETTTIVFYLFVGAAGEMICCFCEVRFASQVFKWPSVLEPGGSEVC